MIHVWIVYNPSPHLRRQVSVDEVREISLQATNAVPVRFILQRELAFLIKLICFELNILHYRHHA